MKRSLYRLKGLSGRLVLAIRRFHLQIAISFAYVCRRKATLGSDQSENKRI
jgi:hypothetical protein